jgi:VIT1/CCC1 family predicted Fe2+/Mn2+ transporter
MTGGMRAHFRELDDQQLMLQYIQPGLVGLIDGTLSTLAPIFAAAVLAGSHTALFVGLATAIGAGISMGLSEGLSDTGAHTGRGSGVIRGIVTGLMTTIGGCFHTLPFLISDVHTALIVASIVVLVEVIVISWIRKRYLFVSLRLSFLQVALGGVIIVAVGLVLGSA